jgi:hypothetical protein
MSDTQPTVTSADDTGPDQGPSVGEDDADPSPMDPAIGGPSSATIDSRENADVLMTELSSSQHLSNVAVSANTDNRLLHEFDEILAAAETNSTRNPVQVWPAVSDQHGLNIRCYLPPWLEGIVLIEEFNRDFDSKMPLILPSSVYDHMRDCYDHAEAAPRLSWQIAYSVIGLVHRLRALGPSPDADNSYQAEWYLSKALLKMPDILMKESTHELVQTMLGWTLLLRTSFRSQRAATFAAMAVRAAQDLGYHDLDEQRVAASSKGKEQQYVFWCAFCLDVDMSFARMKPCSQRSVDIGTPLPQDSHIDLWSGASIDAPSSELAKPNFFAARVKLAVIQTQALEHFHSIAMRLLPQADRIATIRTFVDKVHAWRNDTASIMDVEARELALSTHRPDLLQLIALKASYLQTLYQLKVSEATQTSRVALLATAADTLPTIFGLDVSICYPEAKHLFELLDLLPRGAARMHW